MSSRRRRSSDASAALGEPRSLEVGSRRLHHEVAGVGTPTVVFEAGLGMSGVVWALVQPLVAEATATVVYDRAGIGGSDRAREPRTLEALAADLGSMLDALPGPFVLVGHSWGGPIVRVAAATRSDVRSLVLVDPSDENDDSFFTAATRRRMTLAGPVTRALAATGLYRRAASMGDPLPEAARERFARENFGRLSGRQLAEEVRWFLPGLRRLRDYPLPASGVPVTILSAGGGALVEAHARSAHARVVVVEGAGHMLPLERPRVVADEILRVLSAPS